MLECILELKKRILSAMSVESYDYFRSNKYELIPYLINDGEKHPFAIICPGGGYFMVASHKEGDPIAKELNKRGYHAFVLYYRVRRKARYPHPQEDLKEAINTVFSHADEWKIDTSNWSLWGSSAGGHLVASLYIEDWNVPKPTALVLIYPVITLGEHAHHGSRKNLLGRKPSQEMVDKESIHLHINKDFPKTYIWNGTKDRCVNPINSDLLEEALKTAGVSYRRDVYPNIGHGVGLAKGTNAENWFNNALEFIEQR